MATFKRGNIWHIAVRIPGSGRYVRRSSKSTQKKDALALERKIKDKLADNERRGVQGLPPRRLFGEALVRYIESGQAPKSMSGHITPMSKVMRHVPMEERPIIEAAAKMKDDYLAAGLSPQTVNRRLSVVQRVLNLAYREWRWLEYPLAEFIAPMQMDEREYARHVYLTATQAQEYFDKVTNLEARRAMFGLAFSGLRTGELLRLKPENWMGTAIRMDAKSKGKKPRSVPIPEFARPLFEDLPFRITYRTLHYWMDKARGEDDVRLHDLRHTFASWLADDPNIPMTMIRDLLGHSSISVTNRYSHIRHERLTIIEKAIPTLKWRNDDANK